MSGDVSLDDDIKPVAVVGVLRTELDGWPLSFWKALPPLIDHLAAPAPTWLLLPHDIAANLYFRALPHARLVPPARGPAGGPREVDGRVGARARRSRAHPPTLFFGQESGPNRPEHQRRAPEAQETGDEANPGSTP